MIQFKSVSKSYDGQALVVDHLNLEIAHGEFMVLLGESGCGKTTTLKMINRLEDKSSGTLLVSGQEVGFMNPIDCAEKLQKVVDC